MALSILKRLGAYSDVFVNKVPQDTKQVYNNMYVTYPEFAMMQFDWVTHNHVDGSVQSLSKGTKSTWNLHNQIQTIRKSYLEIQMPALWKEGSTIKPNYIRGAPFHMIDQIVFYCGKDRALECTGREMYDIWLLSEHSDNHHQCKHVNVPTSWNHPISPWHESLKHSIEALKNTVTPTADPSGPEIPNYVAPEQAMHQELIDWSGESQTWIIPLVNLPWGRSKAHVFDAHRCGKTELTMEVKWVNSLTEVVDFNGSDVGDIPNFPTLPEVRANLISYGYTQTPDVQRYYRKMNSSIQFFEPTTITERVPANFSDGVNYKEIADINATKFKGIISGVMAYFVPDMATDTGVTYEQLPGKIGNYDPLMVGAGLPGKPDLRYNIKELTFTLNKNRVTEKHKTRFDEHQSTVDWFSGHHKQPKVPMSLLKISDEIMSQGPMQTFEPAYFDRPALTLEMKTKDPGTLHFVCISHWPLDYIGENVGREYR